MKKIHEMTLQEKIGQVIAVGFAGTKYDQHIDDLIQEKALGNVILFARNIDSAQQLHDLNHQLHTEIEKKTGVLPFISIDQEGGMVTRIMNDATFCPGNMTLGATKPEYAYEIGSIMGKELAALGVNMNLAPSLDVNNNPNNPVIGVRSYSDQPEVVSHYGNLFIKGLQEQGILATAKHFPGHGDTEVDSHKGLPIVPHSKKRLDEVELYPFKKAIEAGVWAIMSAHVFFTAYETGNLPATLSKKVMTDLIRKDLGFEGLLVSDCMEMKAIDDTYGAAQGALMGLLAGLDMALISQTPSKQREAFRLVEEAVANGTFPMELLDEKVERILRYKEKSKAVLDKSFFQKDLQEKMDIVLNPAHKAFAQKVVEESLTKVRGKEFYPAKKTLVVATTPFATTIAEDEVSVRSIVDQIKLAGLPMDTLKIKVQIDEQEIEQIIEKAMQYEQVVVCTYNALLFKNQAKLVRKLYDAVEDLYVISTRNPYDLLAFKQVKNYWCLYEYTPNSAQAIVKFLQKKLYATGKLPVSLDVPMKIGASIYVGLDDYSLEDNLRYIDTLKDIGIDRVFISAHMPEMADRFKGELQALCAYAKDKEIKIILDVSKPIMDKLDLPEIYALRLDWGFTLDDMMEFYHQEKFLLELNASTLSKQQLEMLKSRGMDFTNVRVSHNFYPKPYTGLSQEDVQKRNDLLHSYGFSIMGYVPSRFGKRPPLYEGLPTVEDHRTMDLELVLMEMKKLDFDEVFFGDAYVDESELKLALEMEYDVFIIPISITAEVSLIERELLEQTQRFRRDESPYFKRSSKRVQKGIEPKNTVDRKYKDITIDNQLFGRYQGEVSLVMRDMPKDERVNVVGRALVSDHYIAMIQPGDKVRFKIVGEK